MIYLVNLLHLISTRECLTLISEAAQALTPDGCLILYGPFMRGGALTSAGDQRFDATLRASDPQIGYKDDQDIIAALRTAGLAAIDVHNMPANNLAFVARSTSL